MELNEFKTRIKNLQLCGCYIFLGEEDYLKKHYLSLLRESIVTDKALAPFNYALFDGADVNFAEIQDAIKSPPMMSDRKLIEWRYASFEKMKESDLDAFEKTLALLKEYDYATLAFLVADGEINLGTPKRESKLAKRFGKDVNFLNFPKSSDQSLLSWLKKHFDAENVGVGAEALRALIFRSGHSMTVLNNEVIKLCSYAKASGKSVITEEDVNSIASSTPECDTFALSNAILAKNKKAAFFALEEMKHGRLDPVMIMGMMSKTYSELSVVCSLLGEGVGAKDIAAVMKMNPYRLEHYISAARRTSAERVTGVLEELSRVDTAAKFGGISGYTAIELFISKCL